MADKIDPWGVKSVAKLPAEVDPWGSPDQPTSPIPQSVAGLPPGQAPPSLPGAPLVNMQMSKVGKLFGNPASYVGVPAQHVGNMVSGVAHVSLDAPQDATESAISGMTGQPALAAYRAFLKPTVESGAQAIDYAKQGKWGQAGQSAMDAIPVAGPWARSVENDAEENGAIPALLGLGTDVVAPMGAAKGIGLAARGAGAVAQGIGKVGEYLGSTPEARKLANTRILVPGEAGDVLTRALKPSISSGIGPSNITSNLPRILEQNSSPQTLDEFGKATDAAQQNTFSKYDKFISPYRRMPEGVQGTYPRPGSVNGNAIADAQMNSIPAIDLLEKPAIQAPTNVKTFNVSAGPEGGDMRMQGVTGGDMRGGIVNNTADVANRYRQSLSIPFSDAIRADANAKLNAFYNRAGGDRASALSNPETARMKAVGDSTRDQLYGKLGEDAGVSPESIRDIQNQYGELSEIGDVANNRANVFGRHDPISLPEKIAASHGIKNALIDYGTQKFLKNSTDSNALIRSGIDRFNNPNGTPLPAAPGMFSQGISNAGEFTGGLGRGVDVLGRKVSKNAGQSYLVPPKKKR